jgi:hypothetical protein
MLAALFFWSALTWNHQQQRHAPSDGWHASRRNTGVASPATRRIDSVANASDQEAVTPKR